jgi:hypothetical protein
MSARRTRVGARQPQNTSQEANPSQESDTPLEAVTTLPQNTPTNDSQAHEEPDQAQTLAELRSWFTRTQEQAELSRLAQLKARIEQGEDVNILEDLSGSARAGTALQAPIRATRGAKLPEPPKPRVFKGQEKASYEEWVRDCETYQRRAPQDLATQDEKVQFGLAYVSADLKRNWEAFVKEKEVEGGDWTPTWTEMKQFMHNQLGSEYERSQSAFQELIAATQGNKSPLELLNYLRPLWAESGVFDTQTRVRWFVSALSPAINRHVRFNYPEEAKTLHEAEIRAMSAYRRFQAAKDQKSLEKPADAQRGRGRSGRSSTGATRGRGSRNQAPRSSNDGHDDKRAKTDPTAPERGRGGRGRGGRFRGGRTGRGGARGNSSAQEGATGCYICHDMGHFATECPSRDNQGDNSGNGKATQPQTQAQ